MSRGAHFNDCTAASSGSNCEQRRSGNPTNSRLQQQCTLRTTATRSSTTSMLIIVTTTIITLLLMQPHSVSSAPTATDAPTATNASIARSWQLIKRADWLARTPTSSSDFSDTIPYVILHHSYQPGVCHTTDACKASMRSMQDFHMDGHGWPDIGYSFAVGGDGNVYEGRGYNVVGAHAPNYNSQSIGLLLIGNFVDKLPPAPMLQVAQEFIAYSISEGRLSPDYILYGHRQVRDTECPGAVLYAEIKTWPHWQEVP